MRLYTAQPYHEQSASSPHVGSPCAASAGNIRALRRRLDQNNRDKLIERIFLQTAAKIEGVDFRRHIMQNNQIRLKDETLPQRCISVSRRKYFTTLILKE